MFSNITYSTGVRFQALNDHRTSSHSRHMASHVGRMSETLLYSCRSPESNKTKVKAINQSAFLKFNDYSSQAVALSLGRLSSTVYTCSSSKLYQQEMAKAFIECRGSDTIKLKFSHVGIKRPDKTKTPQKLISLHMINKTTNYYSFEVLCT